MATRRPKVPRATPAAPKAQDTNDGGDVIQADFGVSRESHPHASGKPHSAGPHTGGSPRQAATPPAAARKNTAAAGTRKSDAAKSGAATSGPGTSGTAKSGTAPGTAKPGSAKPGTAKQSKDGSAHAGEHLSPVPAKAFSGRMLALFVVMIAITIMLAPTVKIFFEKRAEIAALQADISAKQSQQSDLRLQVSRWQDPNYVKQQARDRINMVMPGETGYWVFGSDLPAGTSSGAAGAGSVQDPAELPWVDSLWDSIRRSATD
ncbi:FtsB family cell division protein [Arthrobacter sp. SO3]|uniref:FtsB family cell division protein n=1 Tax=Arthrobacter sp. SO3 TaxID=1897057 RepID=UPI001CFFD166|nr:septum formation initiator family protein [Arthrobacter sp. SO3]MCB5292452.1 Cell division protein FtsL [Arthrobacter sp. SO3]